MKVPLLDLKPQLEQLREEILENVIRVIDSTRYIQGPEVEALEQEIARYSGAAYGIGVSSGTDALLVSLMALDIGHGDKVITTPYSFFATMGVILRLGAIPVFADIEPHSYNIDPNHVERLLTADTGRQIKAVIPVHLYGQCADMQRVMNLCESYGVPVIEDAAQAIGAEVPYATDKGYGWQKAGSIGLAGCFSFFPSKNLGGIGDGGMVISNDETFARKVGLLRNHGAHPKYYHGLIGGNFRLDPIQATVLRVKLKYLEKWHQARRENARRYTEMIAASGIEEDAVGLPQAVYADLPGAASEGRNYHIYNQYVIRVAKRDELRQWLSDRDVGTEIYYPLALHQQKCLIGEGNPESLPEAERAASETIALPIYPELTAEMQEYVVKSIRDFYI